VIYSVRTGCHLEEKKRIMHPGRKKNSPKGGHRGKKATEENRGGVCGGFWFKTLKHEFGCDNLLNAEEKGEIHFRVRGKNKSARRTP